MTGRLSTWISRIAIALLLLSALVYLLAGHFVDAASSLLLAAFVGINAYMFSINKRLRTQLVSVNEQLRLAHLRGGHL